jgi:hypothetical protein
MKVKVGDFVDSFPDFARLSLNEQILLLIYFHTVVEARESVSQFELGRLFGFAELTTPKNLGQRLGFLCGKARKLRNNEGEYSLQRPSRISIEKEIERLRGIEPAVEVTVDEKFNFPGKNFNDFKIQKLLEEAGKCYALQCWNACGIVVRIIIERALDTLSPAVKGKNGLKDKINYAIGDLGIPMSKSTREGFKTLHGAKLVGDIVAHHSEILLDQGDVDSVIPPFRILLKEVKSA